MKIKKIHNKFYLLPLLAALRLRSAQAKVAQNCRPGSFSEGRNLHSLKFKNPNARLRNGQASALRVSVFLNVRSFACSLFELMVGVGTILNDFSVKKLNPYTVRASKSINDKLLAGGGLCN